MANGQANRVEILRLTSKSILVAERQADSTCQIGSSAVLCCPIPPSSTICTKMNLTSHSLVPNVTSYNATTFAALRIVSLACWLLALSTLFGLCLPLCVLIRSPDVRTPFTYYVLNILAAGLVLVVYVVLMAVETGYGVSGVANGWALCPLVDTLFNLGTLVVVYTELAISLNRTWALFFLCTFAAITKNIAPNALAL